MKIIYINGNKVEVSIETFKRIERMASKKRITIGQAISFCLKKVI